MNDISTTGILNKRVIGIDYGEQRVGVAVSDPTGTIATGYRTLKNTPALISELLEIIDTLAIKLIVIGLPLTMKGGDSEKTKEVRTFVEKLRPRCDVEIIFEDERLTTKQAIDSIRLMNTTRKQRRDKDRIDQMAAALILQNYLDRHKSNSMNNQ